MARCRWREDAVWKRWQEVEGIFARSFQERPSQLRSTSQNHHSHDADMVPCPARICRDVKKSITSNQRLEYRWSNLDSLGNYPFGISFFSRCRIDYKPSICAPRRVFCLTGYKKDGRIRGPENYRDQSNRESYSFSERVWKVIAETGERGMYTPHHKLKTSNLDIEIWFIEAGLRAERSDFIPLEEVYRISSAFPFDETTFFMRLFFTKSMLFFKYICLSHKLHTHY